VRRRAIPLLNEWVAQAAALIQPMSRMAGVGILSVLVNICVTTILHEVAGWREEYAYLIGLAAVLVMNFLACRYVIFSGSKGNIRRQAVGFLVSSSAFRGVEYGCFLALHSFMGVHYIISIVAISSVSFLAKFFFFSRVVFGTSTDESAAARPSLTPR
jgi:putative flippase GtrA